MIQRKPQPRTEKDLEDQYQRLRRLTQDHVTWQTDRYETMLEDLKKDRTIRNANGLLFSHTTLGLRRAPAARGNHHDFEGGLTYHLLEMWDVWQDWKSSCYVDDYVDDDRILRGIIHHDLHKAYRYYRLREGEPWTVEWEDGEATQLNIDNSLSIQVLNRYGIILDDRQMNALLWSEGGFSRTRPRWCSVLAKVLYLLDEYSGNVLGRIAKSTLLDHRKPCTIFGLDLQEPERRERQLQLAF